MTNFEGEPFAREGDLVVCPNCNTPVASFKRDTWAHEQFDADLFHSLGTELKKNEKPVCAFCGVNFLKGLTVAKRDEILH